MSDMDETLIDGMRDHVLAAEYKPSITVDRAKRTAIDRHPEYRPADWEPAAKYAHRNGRYLPDAAGTAAAAGLQEIRAVEKNDALSAAGKAAAIESIRARTNAEIAALKAVYESVQADEIRALEVDLHAPPPSGLTSRDRASFDVSRRDAMDRADAAGAKYSAQKGADPRALLDLLERSLLSDDLVLARAAFSKAVAVGDRTTVDAWFKRFPADREKHARLHRLKHPDLHMSLEAGRLKGI